MAIPFDTLGYAKALKTAGIPAKQAEAHAEAARDYIMQELVTKSDLAASMDTLTLRLTVRLGAMIGAGVGLLAVVIKLV